MRKKKFIAAYIVLGGVIGNLTLHLAGNYKLFLGKRNNVFSTPAREGERSIWRNLNVIWENFT
jgi:hypothetical protein